MLWAIGLLLALSQVAQAQVSGTVFRDYNANGLKETTEGGVASVTVTAFFNATVATAVSTTAGSYSFSAAQIPNTTPVRLEFSGVPTGDFSGPFSAAAAGSGTSVQFVTAGASTGANINFGVNLPNDYCQPNPLVAIACYENGNAVYAPTGNTNKGYVTFPFNSSGNSLAGINGNVQISQVGTVWGGAWQRSRKRLFTGALLKRNSGLGPQGTGGVYIIDYSTSAGGSFVSGFSLNGIVPGNGGAAIDLGTIDRTGANALPNNNTGDSRDIDAFSKVGTVGFGDVDLTEDENTLWLVNLNQRALISINVSQSAVTPSSATVSQYPLSSFTGLPTCTNGVLRPWALEFHGGRGYLGLVCSGETGGTAANLTAYVVSFDPQNPTAFTTEVTLPLNYTREPLADFTSTDIAGAWRPWANSWAATGLAGGADASAFNERGYPQPILSDIEFSENGLELGFMDRFGLQGSFKNLTPQPSPTTLYFSSDVAGDIIHYCRVGNSYVLEGNTGCADADNTTRSSLANDGPSGQGEFYYEDSYNDTGTNPTFNHNEISLGGLARYPGSPEILNAVYDPISGNITTAFTQGIHWYNTADGSRTREFLVVPTSNTNAPSGVGKGNGLGDPEVLCNLAPIEIGNRIFRDNNRNGIQDPTEPGISGVTVTLYKSTTLVATATTNADGEYYFSSGIGTNTAAAIYSLTALTAGSAVQLRINQGQAPLTGLSLSPADQGVNDAIDSDFAPGGVGSTTVVANVTLGVNGQNVHTFDAGVFACPTVTFTAPASATTTVCANTTINMSVQTNAVAPDSIRIVYFGDAFTSATDAYTATGGIVLGQVISTTVAGNKTLTFNNLQLPDNVGEVNDTITVYALLVSADGTCQPIAQRTIILRPRPEVTISGETQICTGTTTQLFANAPAGATFQFFLNNGTTAVSTANPYTTPAISTTTTYRVRATLNTCVSDEAQILLTPVVCTPCVSGTGNLGGVVYRDFNGNGVNNAEPGFGGVTVTVFQCDANGGSVQVAQVQTDIKGQYSVTGLVASTDYRVEFSNLPADYEPTARGTQNGTTVQFTRPGSCSISLGLNQPDDYCQDNPKLVTPCYIDGAVSPNTTGMNDVLVSVNYLNPAPANKTVEATRTEIGSTWGIAYSKQTKQLYSAAFLKRHVGLKDGKLGQIYVSDFTQAGTPTTPWLDVSTLGIPGNWQYLTDAQRGLTNAGTPSIDAQSFSLVAAQGLGDIDITEDGSTLYVMDLTNRQLLSINVATKMLNGSFPVPSLCSAGVGTTRPFGLKVYRGKVYAGAVCDAGVSQLRANLLGGIFVFDPATNTFSPTPVLTIPFTYLKGTNSTACNTDVSTHWNAWTNVYPADAITACGSFDVYNQPVLSDIEFDLDGTMILGVFDRFGHQAGAGPNRKPDGTNSGFSVVGGDILRAYFNGTSFELENNAKEGVSSPKAPTAGQNNNQGLGGGEFYWGDQLTGAGAHFETSMGGLALKPGAVDIRLTAGDPLIFSSGGILSLNNTTGAKIAANSVTLYSGLSGGVQNKANGLGDLEILCDAAPIQIGNRVFRDINRNGIQDPCEPPIVGAVVKLYNAAKTTELASVTTNAAGEYYFGSPGSTTVTSTSAVATTAVTFNTTYGLVITSLGTGTAATGLTLTDVSPVTPGESGTINSGTTQINNDAKVDVVGGISRPCIRLTTGGPGDNNHTYDFGLVPCVPPSLTALASSATICQGSAVTLTTSVSPAGSYTYTVTGPAGVTLSSSTSGTAIATGLAVGLNTFTIAVGSGPTCQTTTTVSVSVVAPPSITLTSGTVCAGQPISLTATGGGVGATYVFSATGAVGNILTITPTVTGPYTVTATTSGGCTATATTQVTVNPLPIATLTQTATVCVGQPVTLTATGGTSYTFSTGLIANATIGLLTFTPTSTTTISVTVATASGCASTTSATVTVNPLPIATLTSATICAGETATLLATGGASYTFSTGDVNITGSISTTTTSTTVISVTVASASGCISTTTATVTVNPLPTLVTSVSCNGIATYTVSFTATPGAVVTSSSGFIVGNAVVGITSGQSVTLTTTLNGCSVSTQLNQNCLSNAASLGDYVFEDSNRDGTQDVGEPAIPNVTVILYLNGVASATTTTNSSGFYSFTGLTPGNSSSYSVGFTTPANYTATGANLGGDDTEDSDAIPATGRTQSVTLANGEFNPTLDAGFYLIPAQLGDFVFEDSNRNGQQDTGEPGIPNVVVTLLSSGTVVDAVATNGSGLYSFTGLTPGVPYSVSFTAPVGYSATLQNVTPDATDSDGDPATGLTGTYSLTAGENNPTVDMGYFRPARLGDFVFVDTDKDGQQDAGEPPIPGVTVTLISNGTVVASTTTDPSGLYSFTGLTPGVPYSVSFTTPLNYSATTPNTGSDVTDSDPVGGITAPVTLTSGENNTTLDAGFILLTASLGDYVFEDANRNGQQNTGELPIPGVSVSLLSSGTLVASTTTDVNGLYSFTGLTPGVPYSVSFTAPAGYSATVQNIGPDATDSDGDPATGLTGVYSLTANEFNPTVDQGYFRPASLGNFVFADNNRDGIQNGGDTPISGVIVTLLDGLNTPITSTTTDVNGLYSFTGLTPGVPYSVSFTTPANYSATLSNVGNDGLDSDPVGGVTVPVTLTSGENNTTLDAGFYLIPAQLGDFVFEDSNRNGQQNTGEPGIPGVTVTLLANGSPVASTLTNGSGLYSFTGLTPGVPYSVSFTAPTGYSATLQDIGPDATDSDGNPVTGLTGVYSLTAGENNPTVDMGYFRPASLGDFVFVDTNQNGQQDGNDTPIAGVTVTLLDGTNTPIASTTTNPSGLYSFTGLTPGVPYSVSFTTPSGYSATASNVGNDVTDSDPVGGVTAPVTLTSGENNTTLDAGYYLPCSLSVVVTTGVCNTATNTYSATAVATLTNTTGGVLTVGLSTGSNSLTTAVAAGLSSFTFTAVFNDLPSDNLTRTITASLPGCGTATAQYTAPLACTAGVAVTVTPGVCNTATNQYAITGLISLTNAVAGTATITDGSTSTTVNIPAGATSVGYSLSGLSSGTGSHTVTVSYAGKTASVTYTAPASCLPDLLSQCTPFDACSGPDCPSSYPGTVVPTQTPPNGYIGIDANFNVIVGGNFTVPAGGSAETEGRIAVGGNFLMNQGYYGVGTSGGGSRVIAPNGTANLIVRGDIQRTAGGTGVLGNAQTGSTPLIVGKILVGGSVPGTITVNSGNPADIQANQEQPLSTRKSTSARLWRIWF